MKVQKLKIKSSSKLKIKKTSTMTGQIGRGIGSMHTRIQPKSR